MRRRTNSLSGRERAFSSLRPGTTRRGGEGFQLLLAPNLLLAHTELATATAAAGGKDNTPEQKVGSGEL